MNYSSITNLEKFEREKKSDSTFFESTYSSTILIICNNQTIITKKIWLIPIRIGVLESLMLDKKFLKSSWRLLKCDSNKISSDSSSLTCCIGITFIQNLKRSWEDLSLSQLINRKKKHLPIQKF